MSELLNHTELQSQPAAAADNLWTPDTLPHGFDVSLLPEAQLPIAKDAFFATWPQIRNELARRFDHGDGVRIAKPEEHTPTDERVVPLIVPVGIGRHALRRAVRAGDVHPNVQNSDTIDEDQAEQSGLAKAFWQQKDASLEFEALATLQALHRPDWLALPSETLEHATKVTQVLCFACAGHEILLYNFTDTRVDEDQAGKIANGLRELADRTGAAGTDLIKVMAIADVYDPVLYPQNTEGNHAYNALGIAWSGAIILSEGLFDPDIALPPVEPDPDDEDLDSDHPYLVPGDEIQLTVYHEGLHVLAMDDGARARRAAQAFACTVGWKEQGGGKWAMSGQAAKNYYRYGRHHPDEDIAVTGEADFAGPASRTNLGPTRQAAFGWLLESLHSGVQGPQFVWVQEVPFEAFDLPHGMPSSRPIVLQPLYEYRIIDPSADTILA